MGYLTVLLLDQWSLFTCKEPLNVWLLVTYSYLSATHFLGVLTWSSGQELVEVTAVCVYFFVFLPFSMVWTLLGTIWFAESDVNCVPDYLRGAGLVITLMVSYMYVSVGLALLLMFSMMFFARRQALSELDFIIVPNDDRRVGSLSQSLIETLELHSFTVISADLTCPICYDDMPVNPKQTGSQALKLPGCGHEMHVDCVREWFSLKSTCPVCRGDVAVNLRGQT